MLSEFASKNEVEIKFWDIKKQQFRDLTNDEVKDLKTKDKGFNIGVGIIIEILNEERLKIRLIPDEKEKAEGVVFNVGWSNGESKKYTVGENLFQENDDTSVEFKPLILSVAGSKSLKTVVISDINDSRSEQERRYIRIKFPAPSSRSLADISRN